jgi:hypothetical protein
MPWFRRLQRTFSTRTDADIEDELRFHVEARIAEYVRAGMSEDAARQEATRRFGNITSMRDQTRDWATVRWLTEAADDVRLSWRLLRRHSGFSVVVIAMLAVGSGATTAAFSTVYAVLLRPLPYAEPGELVAIWGSPAADPTAKVTVPFMDFERWRQHTRAFSTLAAATWFGPGTVHGPRTATGTAGRRRDA